MNANTAPTTQVLHQGIDPAVTYRLSDGYYVQPLALRAYGRGEQVVYVRIHQPTVRRTYGLQDWLCHARPMTP